MVGENEELVSSHIVDITDKNAVDALPEEVIAAHGAVDGLINNAGIIQPFVRINDLEFDAIDRVFKINLYGLIYMTKAFLPHLLKRPVAHIINTSSMGGYLPVPDRESMVHPRLQSNCYPRDLNSELLDSNVRVSVVFPGAIETNIASKFRRCQLRSPEDAESRAYQPLRLIKQPRSSWLESRRTATISWSAQMPS